MTVAYIKNKLLKSNVALFEVNNNNNKIKWMNKYFENLFSFVNKNNFKSTLSLKISKNNSFLNLYINKRNLKYTIELLSQHSNNNIYKVNDSQVKKILALKDGIECVKKGQIKFAVQKQIELANLAVLGYEFLARMHLKNGSLISNEDFMPVIESNYQIDFLLPKVLENIVLFKSLIGNTINWINISAEILESKTFYSRFIKLVNSYKLDFKFIGIEITESHKIISNSKIIDSLIKLKKDKFLIAMDDFGSGYANIRRLSTLPVDIVKLDKTFVFDIKNKKTKALIKGIVEIGKNIGYSVLAEGIETKKDLLLIKELGVNYGQGWYVGKPKLL